jgi:hypothetical protein
LRKTLVVLAGLAMLILAAAAVAVAAIPDSSGVIHGCRNTRTGALRVIDTDAGQACTSVEAALNWQQSGGLHGHQVVEVQSTLAAETTGQIQATAVCPAGKVVLGGGGAPAITDQQRPYIARSSPVWDGTRWAGWQVIAYFDLPLPPPSDRFLNAFAICAFPS